MAIETTWKIEDMKAHTSNEGVFEATWTVWATREEKYVTEINGVVEFNPDPNDADFTAYDDLTEDVVIGWVQTVIGKDEAEQLATDKLNKLHPIINEENPQTVKDGIPWATAE